MPPPTLPVNGVRPKMEERRAPPGPVGKELSCGLKNPCPNLNPQSQPVDCAAFNKPRSALYLHVELQQAEHKSSPDPLDPV